MIDRVRKLLGLHIAPTVILGAIASIAAGLDKAYAAGGIHNASDALVVALPLVAGLIAHKQTTPLALIPPGRKYPVRPSIRDARDWLYTRATTAPLPASVDLRRQGPPVYDQGQLGSCTANAVAGALEFDQIAQREKSATPSRLFIYWFERQAQGTIAQDSGATLREGIQVAAKVGAPPETLWPYVIGRFRTKPPKKAVTAAAGHKATVYRAVDQTLDGLRGALADGHLVVFGFSVYESFESDAVATSGRVPMPQPSEKLLGGHAVALVGYDDATGYFTVRNSWGAGWGAGGYCFMPYHYLTDPSLASDFWVVERVA